MNYKDYSKEQLLEVVEGLERLNEQLLKEKEQEIGLDYAWTGNLGHWYWDIKTNAVTFNPLKVTTLGYELEEIPEKVTYQFFVDKLHPEDYPKTMKSMSAHLRGESHVYEVEYRIRTKAGDYKWYYDRGRITKYDDKGRPEFLAGIVFDITEKKLKEQSLEINNKILEAQSLTDGLLQINNRRAVVEFLQKEINTSQQTGRPLSIAMLDLDHFKKINDTKGHVFGDKVLIDTAKIIQENIRETDFLGRYGGEEFLVIFKNTKADLGRTIAERIRSSIEAHCFEEGVKVTISGGVYEYHGSSLSDFIHEADTNLYAAKNQGRNRII